MLLAGLLLFLAGLMIMSRSLRSSLGRRLSFYLGIFAERPLLAMVTGALATAVVHSSSAVTIISIGLVDAGVLGLVPAFAVVLGANIGTTATAQLAAFDLSSIVVPSLTFGAVLSLMGLRPAGRALTGFGLLALGLTVMESAAGDLSGNERLAAFLAELCGQRWTALLAGSVVTGIIQSSTAFTGMVIGLSREGLVDLPGAVALVLGGNIGTCVDGLLAGAVSGRTGRKLAWANFVFNTAGAILFTAFLEQFTALVAFFGGGPGRQVANAHSLFNVITSLAVLPLAGPFLRLVTGYQKGDRV